MSADNYINIYRWPDGRFRGYMGFESDRFGMDDDQKYNHHVLSYEHPPLFDVATEDEAWAAADKEYTEYGVSIYNHPDIEKSRGGDGRDHPPRVHARRGGAQVG